MVVCMILLCNNQCDVARILITGAGGFVGKNLLAHPDAEPHAVFAARRGALNLDSDVCSFRPDCIIHLAGRVGGIADNISHPDEFLTDNLRVGLDILDVAKRHNILRLINIGSSCMYPLDAPQPFREESLFTGPVEPTNESYAMAKLAIAKLCEGYGYKTLVPSNLYGPHGHFDGDKAHAVHAIMARVHRDKMCKSDYTTVWGDGTARREFLFVGDLAGCIWRAVEHYDSLPVIMNVGTGIDLSMDEWTEAISRVVGFTGKTLHLDNKPSGAAAKVMDATRARDWGWVASTSAEDGLRQTLEWYQQCKK
jgi:GDP-L-fucose synthase